MLLCLITLRIFIFPPPGLLWGLSNVQLFVWIVKKNAEAFLKTIKAGSSLSEEGTNKNLKVTSTGFFKRNDSIPEIGMERDLGNAAFLLSKEKKWPEKVIKGKSKYFVIEFKDRKKPEAEGFEKEKTGIVERLTKQKRFKAFESWVSQMKASSEITIEEGYY